MMNHFRRKTLHFLKNGDAAILPMQALMIPVILGLAGLGVDTGSWMLTPRNLQNAADAAVMSAAWEIANGYEAGYEEAALREAEKNGYVSGDGSSIELTLAETEEGYQRIDA